MEFHKSVLIMKILMNIQESAGTYESLQISIDIQMLCQSFVEISLLERTYAPCFQHQTRNIYYSDQLLFVRLYYLSSITFV